MLHPFVPGAGTSGCFVFYPVAAARRLPGRTDRPAAGAAITLTDDAGHTVQLAAPAQRVISLVPSVTETIIALDAGDRIVGRTEYDRDTSLAAVPLIGRGLSPSIEAMIALHPDLVVVWASDKRGDLRGQLEKAKIPVLALEVQDTTDAYRVVAADGQGTRPARGRRQAARLAAGLPEGDGVHCAGSARAGASSTWSTTIRR